MLVRLFLKPRATITPTLGLPLGGPPVTRLLSAQSILPQQRLLAEESGCEAVLAIVRDEEVCERLRGRWQRDQGRLTSGDISCERWAEICAEIDKVLPSPGAAGL